MHDPFSTLVRILEVTARFRSITESQAIRLFPGLGMAEICTVLAQAVKLKLIARKEADIPIATYAKIRNGRTPHRRVVVFYMKTKGKELLQSGNKSIRCLKTSKLTGEHLKRLLHDLLIVEVLIWWMEQHNVKQYWVEDELSSLGENKADLRVLTVGKDNSETQTDCEIVVQNRAKDIIFKSNGMMWFTTSITQKDTIEDFKLHKGVVLINLGGVPASDCPPTRQATKAEQVLIDVLKRNDGVLTAGAVAACLSRRPEKVSAALKRLAEARLLSSSTVQLRPGQQIGAPYKVYAVDRCLIDSWADKEFAVRLSKMIEYVIRSHHTVSKIDRRTETAMIMGDRLNRRMKVSQDIENYA